MTNLERVRDTTQKKILRVWIEWLKNPLQVWTDGEEFYVYVNSQWMTLSDGDLAIYWPVRKEPSWDDRVWTYKTNTPTNLGTLEDGFSATYTFYDYDETTVLKTGTVVDGWTPTAPTDPTREGYTFTWREPEVWPITKNTDYVAQYEETQEDPETPWE